MAPNVELKAPVVSGGASLSCDGVLPLDGGGGGGLEVGVIAPDCVAVAAVGVEVVGGAACGAGFG
jgi:hypothetical protein